MRKITFIGTAHEQNESCNEAELFRILRSIEPDVIFEEIRPADFKYFYETRATLECKAVTQYRRYKIPTQVPVDRYEIPKELIPEFKESLGNIFEFVEGKSNECFLLKSQIDQNTGRFGLNYLNSLDHAQKWERICKIQDNVVLATRNKNWIHLLKSFQQQMYQRNIEMLNNIYA